MPKTSSFFRLSLVLGAVVLLGAACQKTDTTNTNSSTTVTNTTTTNSVVNDSGTFSTGSGATNTSNGQTVTVTISATGIDEPDLTISSGTVVIFHNTDTVSHEISADPHPSHSDLPEFDRIIVPGAVYSFTFTKIGTFGYHDHLRGTDSAYQGSVKVE